MTSSSLNSVQLQPLHQLPTLVDLENLLSWLSDCRESYMLEHDLDSVKQVMLPWLHGAQKQIYAIGIGISKKQTGASPVWTFYKAIEPEPQVEWAYSSSDVALIHNMLLCFFPDAKFTAESPDPCVYLPSPRRESDSKSVKPVADVPEEEPFLQGSIEKLPLDCLLQSLASSRVTGKLILSHREQNSGIYFDDGVPVHCFLDEEEGHDALLQLLTWKAGDFDVFSNERTTKKSITRRIESLLMESAVLIDYNKFLVDNGIDDQTVLEKIPMSYREYLERMKDAPALDQELLSLIATQLDTSIAIGELAAKLGLSRPAWVPAIYAFVKAGVVRIGSANRSTREEQQLLLRELAVQVGKHGFLDAKTQLYTSAAFRYFLQLEIARCRQQHRRSSIILLGLPGPSRTLAESTRLVDCLKVIEQLSGPADLVCCFDNNTLALVLPDVSRGDAELRMLRIQEICAEGTSAKPGSLSIPNSDSSSKSELGSESVSGSKPDLSSKSFAPITLSVGCASYPLDSESLDGLVETAMKRVAIGTSK